MLSKPERNQKEEKATMSYTCRTPSLLLLDETVIYFSRRKVEEPRNKSSVSLFRAEKRAEMHSW